MPNRKSKILVINREQIYLKANGVLILYRRGDEKVTSEKPTGSTSEEMWGENMLSSFPVHPTAAALTSDWSINTFIMIAYEKKIV